MPVLEHITVETAEPFHSIEDIPPGSRYIPEPLLTVDEFYDLIGEESRAELDEGAILVPSPADYWHEDCFGFLFTLLRGFVDARKLGIVLGSRSKVRLDTRTAREPDILFVTRERREIVTRLDINGAPDLVIEIINSNKGRSEALAKVPQYARAAVRELWLVDLLRQSITQMLLADGQFQERVLEVGSELVSTTVPNFHVPVSVVCSPEGEYPSPLPLQELLEESKA